MRKCLVVGFYIISACLLIGSIEGKIIHIPTDYPTIQEGVDSASSGDMVLVAKGTYSGGINMKEGILLYNVS